MCCFHYLSASRSNVSSSMSLVNRVYHFHIMDGTEKCIWLHKMKEKVTSLIVGLRRIHKYINNKLTVRELDLPGKGCPHQTLPDQSSSKEPKHIRRYSKHHS